MRLALMALLGLGTVARGERPLAVDLSAGMLLQGTFWFAGAAMHPVVETSVRLSPASADVFPISVVAGLRVATTDRLPLPLEGFVRADLIGHLSAVSEPTFGVELAVTGLARPDAPAGGLPAGVSDLEAARASPLCASVVVAPLRLHFGMFRLSAAEIHVGAGLTGGMVIFRLSILRLELRP